MPHYTKYFALFFGYFTYFLYLPYILPKSAWEKLRSLLEADPDLAPLALLKRRTFLPTEVNKIYQRLGQL